MSLATTIRAGVATAATAVGALLVTVTHEAKTGTDGDGVPTYATGIDRHAFVMTAQSKVARLMGTEPVLGPTVLFLDNVIVTVEDRITLPDGSVAPVKSVDGIADPAGGVYYAQVECGRPERGTQL